MKRSLQVPIYMLEVEGIGVDSRLKMVNREEKGRIKNDLKVLGLETGWKERQSIKYGRIYSVCLYFAFSWRV